MDVAAPSSSKKPILTLVAGLALAMGLVNGALWYQSLEQHLHDAKQADVSALQEKLASVEKDVAHQERLSDQFNETLKKGEADAAAILSQVSKQNKSQIDEVTLKEAASLLHLAETRMVLLQDKDMVLNLLRLADRSLASVTSVPVQEIRATIQQDIDGVIALKLPDEAEIFHRISSLQAEVTQFQFDALKAQAITAPTMKPAATSVLGQFLSLVSIQRHEVRVPKPLISHSTAETLKQTVLTDLDVAKVGLLHQNEALYYAGLSNVMHELQSLPLKAAELAPLEKEIAELISIHLQRAKISFKSIAALAKGEGA